MKRLRQRLKPGIRIAAAMLAANTMGAAMAQTPPPPVKPGAAAPNPPAAEAPRAPAPAPNQVDLTPARIEGVLAAQPQLDAITEKLPDPAAQPDPNVIAQLDAVVKKHGFASYEEYGRVVDTISLVIGGFDPQTKKYVGAAAVIRQQIAAVQADKTMSAKDKQAVLAELNAAVQSPPPAIENHGNIELVSKYYDRLSSLLGED